MKRQPLEGDMSIVSVRVEGIRKAMEQAVLLQGNEVNALVNEAIQKVSTQKLVDEIGAEIRSSVLHTVERYFNYGEGNKLLVAAIHKIIQEWAKNPPSET
jgi:lysozyme family protein